MPDTEAARDRITFLRGLRAVRAFRPDPVPQEVIDDLLDVARWSGSATNRQPWELILISERATLRTLAGMEGYAGHLATAPLGIVLVLVGDPEREEWEIYDEGRLAERLMLAAHAHGIGSCIGGLIGAGIGEAKALLGIPTARRLKTILSLGYPDEAVLRSRAKPPQARKPLATFVYAERYGTR